MTGSGPVTQTLRAIGEGDPDAAARLLPLVYTELRRLARTLMAKTPPGNTLQPARVRNYLLVTLTQAQDQTKLTKSCRS